MKRDPEFFTPHAVLLAWRLLGVSLLMALWLENPTGTVGLILVLLLSIACLVRWRFPRSPSWTVLADQAVCACAMLFWPPSVFGLALGVLEASAVGAPWFALPVIVIVTAMNCWSVTLAAALLCAALAGWAIRLWAVGIDAARRDSDQDRRERYDLESLRSELLASNVRSARLAELAERARIARDLHDHAGHELTAAHLALQAYGKLHDTGDEQAQVMLDEARRRVGQGLELLRSTVHGLTPSHASGLGAFEEICLRFTVSRVALEVHGNTERIPIHLWAVLEPCLKEGLANGARHAQAEKIDVSLDVGPRIVRLSVRNACRGASSDGNGLGLRSLRQRARAVGGSVTVDASDGFRMVCVLPLDNEQASDSPQGATPRQKPAAVPWSEPSHDSPAPGGKLA